MRIYAHIINREDGIVQLIMYSVTEMAIPSKLHPLRVDNMRRDVFIDNGRASKSFTTDCLNNEEALDTINRILQDIDKRLGYNNVIINTYGYDINELRYVYRLSE